MADLRYTTVAGQFQTELTDLQNEALSVPTVLEAMAKPLQNISETSSFREYIEPLSKGTSSTLTEDRAKTSLNQFTTNPSYNGSAVSTSSTLSFIDHTIEDTWQCAFDIDETGGVDAKLNSPADQAARANRIFSTSFRLWKDDKITAKALESNTWIVPAAATSTVDGATAAAATSFDLAAGAGATTGIAAGDLIKIGNERKWGGPVGGEAEYLDVAIVKSVSTDTITIEDDAANFPTSMSQFGDTFINGLRTSLRAHADGVRIQIDKPTAITETSIDDLVSQIKVKAQRAYVEGNSLVLYVTPEVYTKMQGVSASGAFAPMAANDFLGKEVLATGEFAKMRGFKVTSNANAIARAGGISDAALAKPIHYIWAFESGQTFGYGLRRSFSKTQNIQGSAVLQQHIEYKIAGFTMLYRGSEKSFLIPVTTI